MASIDPSASELARGKITGAAPADQLPQLPVEILLEIVQRSDALTVVRFAATQKLLRGAILAPAFRRRLAASDPTLLLGLSFREYGVRRAVDTPPLSTGAGAGGGQPRVRLDDAITGRYAFKPVAWRDHLLVVRRDRDDAPNAIVNELRVCNAFTGNVTAPLPPISMPVPSSRDLCRMAWPSLYTPALLTAGRSFELLVADRELRTQIFYSDRWEWGPFRDTSFPLHERLPDPNYGAFYSPAVIGRTVYWLCSLPPRCPHDFRNPKILALDVDASEAVVRNVPTHCFSSSVSCCSEHGFNDHVLLASLRGKLCLFVLDVNGISAWTPSDDSETTTWSQQVMVTMSELGTKTRGVDLLSLTQVHLHAFGERSSTMIVEVMPGELFLFDIGQGSNSKGVRFVYLGSKFRHVAYLCLHEIHLVSLLQTMKSFPEGCWLVEMWRPCPLDSIVTVSGSSALEATTEA